jgi:hypothetical protein
MTFCASFEPFERQWNFVNGKVIEGEKVIKIVSNFIRQQGIANFLEIKIDT